MAIQPAASAVKLLRLETLGVKNMSTLKRWAITGASFGAGLAVTLSLIAGVYSLYASKPNPPKPWNTRAITATYDYIDTEGDNNTFVFYYTLQNNTDYDYRIADATNVTLLAKLERQKSLSGSKNDQYLKFDFPLLVPAKQRLRLAIHLDYPSGKQSKAEATKDEREKYKNELSVLLNVTVPNLDGFAIFDESNRYQIDLPKGW